MQDAKDRVVVDGDIFFFKIENFKLHFHIETLPTGNCHNTSGMAFALCSAALAVTIALPAPSAGVNRSPRDECLPGRYD